MTKRANHFAKTILVLAATASLGVAGPAEGSGHSAKGRMSTAEFRNTMRKLWEDHITWTRLYIVSAAANLPDKDATAGRLLQNQTDIGNAIKPFYGEAAGQKLTALLRDHILGAADLIAAAKSSETDRVDAANAKWHTNGDEIATFLSGANPTRWPLAAMKSEMKMHLDLTLGEASARLHGDWAEDIRQFDEIHHHILNMADVLSDGIIAQFPGRFENKR